MKYIMRVTKINPLGNKETKEISLAGLEEILAPEDMFVMEFKLNEIPYLRVHIESRDK